MCKSYDCDAIREYSTRWMSKQCGNRREESFIVKDVTHPGRLDDLIMIACAVMRRKRPTDMGWRRSLTFMEIQTLSIRSSQLNSNAPDSYTHPPSAMTPRPANRSVRVDSQYPAVYYGKSYCDELYRWPCLILRYLFRLSQTPQYAIYSLARPLFPT